jgi:hypothetical protein
MIDALDNSRYDAVVPFGFTRLCKAAEGIVGVFGACTPSQGWCEYAGDVSGTEAADWVARNKSALALIAGGDCSPGLWYGDNDKALPLDAQGSRYLPGLAAARVPGSSFRAANGYVYGSFCHSDISDRSSPSHLQAVESAGAHILDWLFVDAPRVVHEGTLDIVAPIAFGASTQGEAVGGVCPAGLAGDGIEVVGVCEHPGYFDGDDHPIDPSELQILAGEACDGSVRWTQEHDPENGHAAHIHWKTLAHVPAGGLVEQLHERS